MILNNSSQDVFFLSSDIILAIVIAILRPNKCNHQFDQFQQYLFMLFNYILDNIITVPALFINILHLPFNCFIFGSQDHAVL